MRSQLNDNPYRKQLQLESQFKLAQEMKNEGAYSTDEFHRLVGYLTWEFVVLKHSEPNVSMRWDFSQDPTAKVMMELTRASLQDQSIENF